MASIAQDDIVEISGAGCAAANGRYKKNGSRTKRGKPFWTKEGGSDERRALYFNDRESSTYGHQYWAIDIVHTGSAWCVYHTTEDSPLPPMDSRKWVVTKEPSIEPCPSLRLFIPTTDVTSIIDKIKDKEDDWERVQETLLEAHDSASSPQTTQWSRLVLTPSAEGLVDDSVINENDVATPAPIITADSNTDDDSVINENDVATPSPKTLSPRQLPHGLLNQHPSRVLSRTSFEWAGEEEDELFLLDSFMEAQREQMEKLFSRLDTNQDGKIDKTLLENDKELESLGLKTIDMSMLKGVAADSFGWKRFRDAVRVQMAFQKLDEQSSAMMKKASSVTVLDYRKSDLQCPIPALHFAGTEQDTASGGQAPTERSSDASALWKAFLLQPQLNSTEQRLLPDDEEPFTRWVNVDGLDRCLIRQLAVRYQLDPLAIEDALQKEQRPKVEEFEHGLFIVVPMLEVRKGQEAEDHLSTFVVETESVSIFVVDEERTVITVQEKKVVGNWLPRGSNQSRQQQ